MSFRFIRRGGKYLRVADPDWKDPLDGSFSQLHGGRWNPPNSFPVVYLNATAAVARANVRRKLEGLPYGPEDLNPREAPVLVTTRVPEDDFVDIVTNAGCRAAGLPVTYPRHDDGTYLTWDRCQSVGKKAWAMDTPGIASRSAAPGLPGGGEELAWFQRRRKLKPLEMRPFEEWFWS